jgi:hypothetical protein
MVLILKQGSGPEKAPDFEEFVKTLDTVQICFLANLLLHAAEGDYGVVEELFMWVANKWHNEISPDAQKEAVGTVNERFFTVKAFERYQAEMKGAQNAAAEAEGQGKIITMDEVHHGNGSRRK